MSVLKALTVLNGGAVNKIYLSLLFLVGVINFLPIVGILSLDKINQTYGLSIDDNNLAIYIFLVYR